MKKFFVCLLIILFVAGTMGCAEWNRTAKGAAIGAGAGGAAGGLIGYAAGSPVAGYSRGSLTPKVPLDWGSRERLDLLCVEFQVEGVLKEVVYGRYGNGDLLLAPQVTFLQDRVADVSCFWIKYQFGHLAHVSIAGCHFGSSAHCPLARWYVLHGLAGEAGLGQGGAGHRTSREIKRVVDVRLVVGGLVVSIH